MCIKQKPFNIWITHWINYHIEMPHSKKVEKKTVKNETSIHSHKNPLTFFFFTFCIFIRHIYDLEETFRRNFSEQFRNIHFSFWSVVRIRKIYHPVLIFEESQRANEATNFTHEKKILLLNLIRFSRLIFKMSARAIIIPHLHNWFRWPFVTYSILCIIWRTLKISTVFFKLVHFTSTVL